MRHKQLIFLIILLVTGICHGFSASPLPDYYLMGTTRKITFPENNAGSSDLTNRSLMFSLTNEDIETKEESEIHKLASFIKETNRYIDRIDSSAVMDLPVGISSISGALDYTIIIKRLITTPDSGSFLEVYMSFEIPQNGKRIAFAGRRIPFSFSGGIKGDSRIELLGDEPIPLSGNIQLNLKGDGGTYVSFDCNGFRSMGIKADVEFSRNVFIPENPDGSLNEVDMLKSTFTTVLFDWNDLIVELDIPPFQVRNLKGVGFNIKRAVFDFSDSHNAPNIVFPKEYQSSYFSGDVSINLWRGFYLREAAIRLPKEFKNRNNSERLSFFASDLVIDEEGLSGILGVENLLSLEDGDMDGWAFSINNFSVKLLANQLTEAGLSGKMNIPVFKENSSLNYSAVINPGGYYSFMVSADQPVKMSLWAAEVVLLPASNITVTVKNGTFLPEANLTGTLSIVKESDNESDNSKNNLVSVGGISFENMIVRSRRPYLQLGNISFGAGDKSSNLGKFPIIINAIGVRSEEERAGISFSVIVNLMASKEEGFGASGSFIVWGKRDNLSNRWKYSDIEVNALNINVEKKNAFRLQGSIAFIRGDSTYGKGFRGDLDAVFGNNIALKATALFGCVEDMRYWYADALINSKKGIPLCPSLSIYGFGGGAYHHMRQKGFNENKGSSLGATQSGIIYIPSSEIAMGIKASVALGTTKKEVVNGDATFEISFNRNGGINQIAFEGNVYFITSEFTDAMADVSKNTKELANGNSKPAKTSDSGRAQVWGSMKLLFDNANNVFHGDIRVYANVAGGIIKGTGPQDMAGWAVIHFAPSEWYVHIGSPTNPAGLQLARIIKVKSYFMVGHNLPGSPPLPTKVTDILGAINSSAARELNLLGAGKGLAFGASMEVNTGDITFLIFYARLAAGVGFDIMLKDYGDAVCAGRQGTIGINGWYANGQAYAYIEGSIGIIIDLTFFKGKYEILGVGVATSLQVSGPDPFWLKGNVGGEYRILNGLVKGKCRFEFTIGEECKLVTSSPLAGIKIISELTPAQNSRDIDVFNTPQALFNMEVNKEFTFKDEKGNARLFRIKLDYFKLFQSDKTEIPGKITWNSGNDVAGYNSDDILPPNKEITASVQVSFEESVNGVWSAVLFNGKKVTEKMESTFTSGTAPDYIPVSNIEFSYPVLNQFNYYRNEYNQGYIKLKKGQPYLFVPPPGFVQKGKMSSDAGDQLIFNIAYTSAMVTFSLPQELRNSNIYALDLVNIPAAAAEAIDRNVSTVSSQIEKGFSGESSAEMQTKKAEGTIETLQEKSMLTYYFRTSKYSTFIEKINSMQISTGWRWPLRTNVHELGVTLTGDEMFDKIEISKSGNLAPIIQFEALFSETAWYNNLINPLIYSGYPLVPDAVISWRDLSVTGLPPTKAVYIRQYPNNRMLTELDLSGTSTIGIAESGAFVYDVAHYVDLDFYDIRSKLAIWYANHPTYNPQISRVLESIFPGIKYGNYPIDVMYVLPGLNKVTSSKRLVINNPVPDV